jgi:hypothetical protein
MDVFSDLHTDARATQRGLRYTDPPAASRSLFVAPGCFFILPNRVRQAAHSNASSIALQTEVDARNHEIVDLDTSVEERPCIEAGLHLSDVEDVWCSGADHQIAELEVCERAALDLAQLYWSVERGLERPSYDPSGEVGERSREHASAESGKRGDAEHGGDRERASGLTAHQKACPTAK